MANSNGSFEYQYFLKDLPITIGMGNTRVSFNQVGEVIQEDSYYPFGMAMKGLNYQNGQDYINKYLYNRKELQDEFGLEWYNYGARFYDPQLGRWHVIDPMCEIARKWTPYQYAYNNPIRFIDPDGMVVDDFYFNKDGGLDRYVENDEPDRVFFATGETTTDESKENPMPEPVYEQVEMSSGEVEQKMGDNGYKKVTKEETVVETNTSYNYADGAVPSTMYESSSIDKVLDTKTRYTKKENSVIDTKDDYLGTIDRDDVQPVTSKTEIRKKTYTHGNKQKRNNAKKDIQKWGKLVKPIVEMIMKKHKLFTISKFTLITIIYLCCPSCQMNNKKLDKKTNLNIDLTKVNNDFHNSKSFFDHEMVNHFPDNLNENYITYTESVSPEVGLIKLDLICKFEKPLKTNYKKESLATYKASDTCLLVANRFANTENYSFNIVLSQKDSLNINLECYNNKYPIPNFWHNDFTTEETECKIPADFTIYVLESKPGEYLDKTLLTDGRYMPEKWKNGYSKGVSISGMRKIIVYWVIIW